MGDNLRSPKVVIYDRSIAKIGCMIQPLMTFGYDFDAFFLQCDFAEFARSVISNGNGSDILIIGEIDGRAVDNLNELLIELQPLRESGKLVIVNVANCEDGRNSACFDVNFVSENRREFNPDKDILTVSNASLLKLNQITQAELLVPNLIWSRLIPVA